VIFFVPYDIKQYRMTAQELTGTFRYYGSICNE